MRAGFSSTSCSGLFISHIQPVGMDEFVVVAGDDDCSV